MRPAATAALLFILLAPISNAMAGCGPAWSAAAKYPTPGNTDHRLLFYVQNSNNANTVIYEARLSAQGKIEPEHPVDVHWKFFARGGYSGPLKWHERHFAYGIEWTRNKTGELVVNVVARPKRTAILQADADGDPRLLGTVAGHPARLVCAYVQLKEHRPIIPRIAYVDLFGEDLQNGKLLHERIIPRDYSIFGR